MLLAACGLMPPVSTPTSAEIRQVTSTTDSTKTLMVVNGLVFYDSPMASRGIRYPPGTYTLEAEDSRYWYFHAPAPLELRTFKAGKMVDGRNIPGGIMLAKSITKNLTLPAAGYIDNDGPAGGKMVVWKMGGEFLGLEKIKWTKLF